MNAPEPNPEPEQAREPHLPAFAVGHVEPGVYHTLSPDDYHRGPGVSKSDLTRFQQSPLHLLTYKAHPPLEKHTEATRTGSAFHCLILEPDEFPRRYVRSEFNEFRSAAAKAWLEEQREQGLTVLRTDPGADPFYEPSEWDLVHRMRDAIMSHPVASILFDPDQIQSEVSYFARDEETGLLVKCRPDATNRAHKIMVDLKRAADASYTGFGKACATYGYHLQDPHYSIVTAAAGDKHQGFVFVAVEPQPPYAVGVYTLNRRARELGTSIRRELLRRLRECVRTGEWPAYPPEIRELELPKWAEFVPVS